MLTTLTRQSSAPVPEAAITGGLSSPQPIAEALCQLCDGRASWAGCHRECLCGTMEQARVSSEEEGPPFLGPVYETHAYQHSFPGTFMSRRFRLGQTQEMWLSGLPPRAPTCPREQLRHPSLRELGLRWSRGLLGLLKIGHLLSPICLQNMVRPACC